GFLMCAAFPGSATAVGLHGSILDRGESPLAESFKNRIETICLGGVTYDFITVSGGGLAPHYSGGQVQCCMDEKWPSSGGTLNFYRTCYQGTRYYLFKKAKYL